MKRTVIFALITGLLCSHGLHADEVYVTVDEDGVPVFSDQKTPNSTKIKLQDTVTFSGSPQKNQERVTVKLSPDDQDGESPDYKLLITDPPSGSAIRENSGLLTLTLSIKPALLPGHKAELLMDGTSLRTVSGSGPVELTNLDRGTHQFSIRIVDAKGRIVADGPASSISMLRHFIKRSN